jgi:nitrate/TMAO reductase-like tetraheme cytochrome c subunit
MTDFQSKKHSFFGIFILMGLSLCQGMTIANAQVPGVCTPIPGTKLRFPVPEVRPPSAQPLSARPLSDQPPSAQPLSAQPAAIQLPPTQSTAGQSPPLQPVFNPDSEADWATVFSLLQQSADENNRKLAAQQTSGDALELEESKRNLRRLLNGRPLPVSNVLPVGYIAPAEPIRLAERNGSSDLELGAAMPETARGENRSRPPARQNASTQDWLFGDTTTSSNKGLSNDELQNHSRLDATIPTGDRLLENKPNPSGFPMTTAPTNDSLPNDLLGSDLLGGGLLDEDFLGGTSGDPLSDLGPSVDLEKKPTTPSSDNPSGLAAVDPHAEVFAESLYPSAATCAKCHEKIYDEWRVSGHAYSVVSPMYQRFEQAIKDLTRGTVGDFCARCHAPVATQLEYPSHVSVFEGPKVLREGITCVACHRVVERYGRNNGDRRIEPGSIWEPVVGGIGGEGVHHAISKADHFKIKTDPTDKGAGVPIHLGAIKFEQLSDSSFCASCHQVVVQPGIALEIVYQQYRSGPACKKGVSCQDCHMGKVPGKASGYETAPAAIMSGKSVTPIRKHANHMFYGPGFPIAHPGIFPHNEKSLRWKASDWLEFDWRSGWGTQDFEKAVADQNIPAEAFPPMWQTTDDRRDARKIVDDNLDLTLVKRETSRQVLENGSAIDGPFFRTAPAVGQDFRFSYSVQNTSEGHNMPSGSLGAQPQLWLNAVLIDPDGYRIWESGYLDGNGDLADLHSLQVQSGLIPRDSQLFNLQTKFLITTTKGTDREMALPVNVDADPLPFFRPGVVPYTVLNHPPTIRMEAHSIAPLDSRTARYKIDGKILTKPGKYRLSVRMRSRVEPIYFVRFVNGTREMQRMMNERIIDVHPYSTEFIVR